MLTALQARNIDEKTLKIEKILSNVQQVIIDTSLSGQYQFTGSVPLSDSCCGSCWSKALTKLKDLGYKVEIIRDLDKNIFDYIISWN